MNNNNVIYKVLRCLYHFVNFIRALPRILRRRRDGKTIWCEAYIKQKNGKFINNNWGDDLNKYLFEYITDRKVAFLPFTRLHPFFCVEHYSLIGSIIGFYRLDNVIVYGSGLMDPDRKITGKPEKVLCVRGPKTRAALIDKGIECPEIYGDPALLIPLFYSPPVTKRNIITVIYNEATPGKTVEKWASALQYDGEIRVLSMTSYQKWTDIVDSIAESRYVISESLHGLIVAEAFYVPSVWVEFIQHQSFWSFKYEDFYESIGKYNMESVKIFHDNSAEAVFEALKNWKCGEISCDGLLDAFPFDFIRSPDSNRIKKQKGSEFFP